MNGSLPVWRRRTIVPRQNSWPIDVAQKMIVASTSSEIGSRSRSAKIGDRCVTCGIANSRSSTAPAVTANGIRNWFSRRCVVVLRHASSGAAPARNSNTMPSGVIQRLKNSAPTDTREPSSASLIVGNIVANSTKNAQASRIQLLSRNANSREKNDSNVPSVVSLLER